jgi:hypothetical protein
MKTDPMRPLASAHSDLLLAEEVLLSQPNTQQGRRVLLSFALVFMANALRAKAPFDLRRLDDTLLAQFDGIELTARAEITVSLAPVGTFLEHFSQEITREFLGEVSRQRPSASTSASADLGRSNSERR